MTRRSLGRFLLLGPLLALHNEEALRPAYAEPPAELTKLLEPIRKRRRVPALAAALVANGKTATVGAVGVRKLGEPAPVTDTDRFHLGSCTKAMTALLLGTLVDAGKLRWETTLAEAFPEQREKMRPEYREVTLEQLLSHRGGFPEESWPRGMTFADVHGLPGSPMQQRGKYAELFLTQPPQAAPGTKFIYSNAGYAVAGVMAERIEKTPWEALLTRRVFEPLAMKTAGFGSMGTPGKVDQPWQHIREMGKTRPIPPGARSDNPAAIGPAGTVHCSLGDWAKYVAAHLEGARGRDGLVKAATFRKLHTPPPGEEYALGWVVAERDWGGGKVLTHTGTNNQNFAVVWMAPERNFAVLAAANVGGDDAAEACDEAASVLIEQHLRRLAMPPA